MEANSKTKRIWVSELLVDGEWVFGAYHASAKAALAYAAKTARMYPKYYPQNKVTGFRARNTVSGEVA